MTSKWWWLTPAAETLAELAVGVEADERCLFLQRQIERLPERYRWLITPGGQQGLSCEEIVSMTSLSLVQF